MAKYSKEQRDRAVDLYIRYERRAAASPTNATPPPRATRGRRSYGSHGRTEKARPPHGSDESCGGRAFSGVSTP